MFLQPMQRRDFFTQFGSFLKLYRQLDKHAATVCDYSDKGNTVMCFQFPKARLKLFQAALKLKGIPVILIEDKETAYVLCILRDTDSQEIERIWVNVLHTVVLTPPQTNALKGETEGGNV